MPNELKQASIEDLLSAFNGLKEVLQQFIFSFGHLDVNEIFRITDDNQQLILSSSSNSTKGLAQGLYHLESNVECFISISQNGVARLTGRHIFPNAVYGTIFIKEGEKIAGITSGVNGTLFIAKVE